MKIFQDFPFLRRIIGNHGGPLKKMRPINSRMEGLFTIQNIDAYLIMDTDGWRRELVPMTIDSISKFLSLVIRFDGFKFYKDYYPIGLAFFDRGLNAWVINPFTETLGRITPKDTLTIKYTLDHVEDYETYIPYEEIEYENL